jgi:hypothetical protein
MVLDAEVAKIHGCGKAPSAMGFDLVWRCVDSCHALDKV